VSQNPFSPKDLREIEKKSVTATNNSAVSVMLPGLINRLSPDELRDLMAYIKSGGNDKDSMFVSSDRLGKK
jgi:hypothetical protein